MHLLFSLKRAYYVAYTMFYCVHANCMQFKLRDHLLIRFLAFFSLSSFYVCIYAFTASDVFIFFFRYLDALIFIEKIIHENELHKIVECANVLHARIVSVIINTFTQINCFSFRFLMMTTKSDDGKSTLTTTH